MKQEQTVYTKVALGIAKLIQIHSRQRAARFAVLFTEGQACLLVTCLKGCKMICDRPWLAPQ